LWTFRDGDWQTSVTMSFLITGATGFVGGHLLQSLCSRGKAVRALVRDPKKAAVLRARGIEVCVGDIRDAQSCLEAVRGADVVFHCAAASGRHPTQKEIYEINFLGVKNLLEAVHQAGRPRLVHISGLSVLGIGNYLPAHEDRPWRWSRDYEANTKIDSENLILEYREQSNLDVVIVRPGTIYGPGDDNLSQVLQAIREGRFAYIGSKKNIIPLVHVRDFIEAMQLAGIHPQACGRTYHITDGTETTIEDIVDYLAFQNGCPKPRLVLPYFIPYSACWLFQLLRTLGLRSSPGPIEWAGLRFLGTSRSVPIRRAVAELGFSPRIFFREGLLTSSNDLPDETPGTLG
jgi:nucleoside-diphosphate-sugar epimerase